MCRFRWISVLCVGLSLLGGCRDAPIAGVEERNNGAGQILWRVPTAEPPLLSSAVAADDSAVYFYLTGRRFTAVNLQNQRTLWTAVADESGDANNAMRGVELCAGSVIFGTAGAAYGYDPAVGTRRWRWVPSQGGLLNYAGPACSGSTLVFGTAKPMRVYGVNAATGAELWSTAFGDSVLGEGFLTTPAIDNGIAVFCSREFSLPFRGAISAFSITTGSALWRFTWTPVPPLVDASCGQRVRANGGVVVAAVDDGRIFGINVPTGTLRWTAPPVPLFRTPRDERALAITDSMVVAGSLSGRLIGIDLGTGAERWNITDASAAGSIFNFGLEAGSGEVVGINLSGWLVSYAAASGVRRWAVPKGIKLEERAFLSPGVALTQDLVLGRANDGVYAIRRR
jgi:outer membrane protein assembly factor BamB